MSNKCDKHNRIRVLPEIWAALLKEKKRINSTISIPALANDLISRGIKASKK